MDLQTITQRLIEGDAKGTADGVRETLDDGTPATSILGDALIPGMEKVGNLFSEGEYFVPELLLAARAMSAALEILTPKLEGSDYKPAGTVVMGTVQGDMHDIGKNLVAIMLRGCGFEVVDLGADVAPQQFVEAARDSGAKLVGLSALLSTTLPAMEATVAALRASELGEGVRVMVGGAPVTDEYREQIGADGYAPDASSAATLARQLAGISDA